MLVSEETKMYHFLDGDGEMAFLTRSLDWSQTVLGPVDAWPAALKTTVGIVLHSDFPMFLWWGDEMIQFYNDAYRPSLGNSGKHPGALGQKAVDCWPEIWDTIYPLIYQVKTKNKSFFLEDQLIPIYRNGALEDVYWTFSYSSVMGESGRIDGVLVVCNETTQKVKQALEIERAQARVVLSELNLRNVILQAPVAMCILRGARHIVEIANDRMIDLWGTTLEAVINKPIFDGLPEVRDQGFEKVLNNVFASGETFHAYGMPVNLRRHGAVKTVYVHFVYEAFRGDNGSISGVMAVAVDVTEQVEARKKLEQSEHQIRSLVESAPFPIGVYTGKEMRIQIVNQAIIDVWGKGRDIVGKLYSEVLPELESQNIYPKLEHVYTTGVPFHARNQRIDLTVNGTLRPFYFNYSFTPLYDSSGEIYGVMNMAADVTDLIIAKQKVEQSEQNYRNIVKQAPVAMCIMRGPDHVVEVANDLIIDLWGKPESQVMNKPVFEGLPDARQQGLESLLNQVYTTGKSFHANERPVVLFRHGKYETVYQNFVYVPYRDSSGVILGVLAITLDVTQQVLARQRIEDVVAERTQELAVANSDLQRSNAELKQYAYITSHDLQEPARKISTFIDILRNNLADSADASTLRLLTKIEAASTRMLTLIRDILTLSQLSTKNYQFEKIDLNTVLRNICEDFELLIEQSNARIESDALPVIDAIPVQMNQLFTNLISNAVKFVPADIDLRLQIRVSMPGEAEISSYPDLRPSVGYCKLSFIDNGIGFNQGNAGRIFDIFQRLHSKSEYPGTGIGLALCRKIAENHGGYITATSIPGEGATFIVILPVSQDN